jgi:hypothetical protein
MMTLVLIELGGWPRTGGSGALNRHSSLVPLKLRWWCACE